MTYGHFQIILYRYLLMSHNNSHSKIKIRVSSLNTIQQYMLPIRLLLSATYNLFLNHKISSKIKSGG